MQAQRREHMPLNDSQLRDIDRVLLDYLAEGRVTPRYARERVLDDERGWDEITNAYLGQRLKRFVEHGHAQNLYSTGLYELDGRDPRDE